MFKVEVVKRQDKEGGSWGYVEDLELRKMIEWVLQEPLEDFVRRVLVETCRRIGADVKEAANFYVRVVHSDELKFGFCFRRNRAVEEVILPDVLAGFADDVPDFAATIAHEALHVLGWSEYVTEKKALSIIGRLRIVDL